MKLDLSKVSRPTSTAAALDPIEIFRKTPSLPGTLPDLWSGQSDTLKEWHQRHRTSSDVIVSLNTGAGKTIVGLLMAQSLVNERLDGVVFACATIDLVNQTARECDRIGLKYTTRVGGKFSNDLYATGHAFCLTTYQMLFLPTGPFHRTPPKAVIFDDAHVAERIVRESFTLRVTKRDFPGLYDRLIAIVQPEFDRIGKAPHLDAVLSAASSVSISICPPSTANNCREQILSALNEHKWRDHENLRYGVLQLYEHFQHCLIAVSPHAIEITPPFIPTDALPILKKDTRRIYLSATLDFETDFVRAFGKIGVPRIQSETDAGNGERLILLASEMKDVSGPSLASQLVKKHKVLIAVPSNKSAKNWTAIGTPPQGDFSIALNAFREADKGAFVLVSRIDGIDLPQDTCRVMFIDGMPSGASLLENYLFQKLSISNLNSTKMASRIAQLFGRINRGRSDYGAYFVFGHDLNVWLKRERTLSLLPALLRKQIALGRQANAQLGPLDAEAAEAFVEQVIARDENWLNLYQETRDGLDLPDDVLKSTKDRESQLAMSAVAECRFMTRLWEGDIEAAKTVMIDSLNDTAIADSKLAGWHAVWLGMCCEIEGDPEGALVHYRKARSRLSTSLPVPIRFGVVPTEELQAKTPLQEALLTAHGKGAQAIGDLTARLSARAAMLEGATSTTNQHEEALREYGELLGLRGVRPDNDEGAGPDVMWLDESAKTAIAFELKTDKKSPAVYNKNEIGQAHNHLQWIIDNFPDYKCNGVIIVGPAGSCTSEASPSGAIFHVDAARLVARLREFAAKVADYRARSTPERLTLLYGLGELPEWQVSGWHAALATTPMSALIVR